MAERRMFAKSIVLSDAFLDMPLSARALYMTLGMVADDDGFVNNPRGIMRQCGASVDDLNVLLSKKFILAFESGVIVIKHWRINNYLRTDRYQETKYLEEKSQLEVKENGSYTFGIPNSGIPSIGKDRIGKDRIDKDRVGKERLGITHPTLDDVKAYCEERKNGIDAQHFIDYYSAQGWKLSNGNPLKDWKAAVRNWERRDNASGQKHESSKGSEPETEEYGEEFERFWSVYPKRKDKQNALNAFKKVTVPVDELIAAVEKQKKWESWTREDGRYIPYPTTWLNGKRWEDESGEFRIDDPESYEEVDPW